MERIKVLIVEDDPDWLRGLTAYLAKEPDVAVVAQASTAEDALTAIRGHELDIVLMDIMLASSMEGIWLTEEVCRTCTAKVIMLSSLRENDVVFSAFQAGATDYVVKSDFAEIPAAIRGAHQNRSSIHASVAEQMREEFRRLKQLERQVQVKEVRDKITPAELQVLEMIDSGYTQTDIADKLVVSIRTIKVHVGNILKKLGGGSSKDAAKKARDMGFFDEKNK
jgi:DNA-binding NarL/FixJ family response regulator